jgi:glycine dehydrogenase subunit 2
LRGWAYIRTLGPNGLKAVSEQAVLNANYLLSRFKGKLDVPHGDRCMHEFVASAKALRREKKISAMDICKRLIDHGFHAPTVYFPLVVAEALMTESKETLDAFADAFLSILEEEAAHLQKAPHTTAISRPDEVKAAKEPILRWAP